MRLPMVKVWYALLPLIALTLVAPGSAAVEYTILELGSPGFSWAADINNRGQVVGHAHTPEGTRAVLWEDGQMLNLGTLPGGTYSEAYAINDRGQVVGWGTIDQSTCTAFDGCWHAFLWEDGTMTDLGGLDPRFQSYAYSINNSGQIVGISATADYPDGNWRAVRWDNGILLDLGKPQAASNAFAQGVNARGDAVGSAYADGVTVPILWTRDAMLQLPTLPGTQHTVALKINTRGQIVGQDGANRALFWADGTVTAIPGLPGAARSVAYDLNEAGLVAGESLRFSGFAAFVWDGRETRALPRLPGWTETYARGLNDRGDVAGTAATPNGLRAVVWIGR